MSTPTADTIERDLAFARQAAHAAGERALAIRVAERWEGKMLADVGDQACDGYLQGFIRGRYPDDAILSEETADSAARLEKERVWIVDPLDGTKEYSQLRHDWAVHVALTVGGKCALGAVALPAEEEILWGVCLPGHERAGIMGGGGFVDPTRDPDRKPKVVCSRSHTPPWVEAFAEKVGAELMPCGSVGFKVSRLLEGEADIYVHKVGLKEWDTCAPEAVARALGWHVCKLRGEEHVYNQRDPRNHELVICRPAWKERVLAAVAASGALEA